MDLFYTLVEVADMLKVTRQTVMSYIKNGQLRCIKLGKTIRITEADLQTFIDACRK